jgi:hypothetical protein
MGTSVHLGSVDWTYNTPTQFFITIYRCMATREGHTRGLEAADELKRVLDLVGLPIEGVRANLHDGGVVPWAPPPRPYREVRPYTQASTNPRSGTTPN